MSHPSSRASGRESSADPVAARVTTRVTGEESVPEPGRDGPYEVREPTFDIVVLGDLSGRQGVAAPGAESWVARRATPDNAPELAGFRPTIALRLGGRAEGTTTFEASRLDDFNPDSLFRTHPLFAELREARAAAEEGRDPRLLTESETTEASPAVEDDAGRADRPAADAGDAGLLDRIVEDAGGAERGREATSAPDPDLRAFVREIVRPHLVRAAPDRSADIAALDRAAGELMRAVVHDPAFRALEALWRAVGFLLSRIDTTGKVRVHLVDLPRRELERDLSERPDPSDSRLARLLARPDTAGGPSRWSLVVGGYDFGAADLPLVGAIGRCARAAGVPWISGAEADLATRCANPERYREDTAFDEEWRALRGAPEAASLVLAFPGFLVREPWGSEFARPCRAFGFREEDAEEGDGAPEDPGARRLLWACPAFAAAAVLAGGFARHGRAFTPERAGDLSQVPLAPPDPGTRFPRATETRLAPSDASRLGEIGLTALVEFPTEARLRVVGIRPMSSETGRLEAWWTGSE